MAVDEDMTRDWSLETMNEDLEVHLTSGPRVALTIIHHTKADMVGRVATGFRVERGGRFELSRLAPMFHAPAEGQDGRPLGDPAVSRRPITITGAPGSVTVQTERHRLLANGQPLDGSRTFSTDALAAGVALEFANRVVVLLHTLDTTLRRGSTHSAFEPIIGASDAVVRLRSDILRVADRDVPVLLRGESGVGKELTALALHAASPRRDRPFVAVNIAAVPSSVAASELFGHVRGAFTGAATDSPGLFVRADGGTLFLDEIGDAPLDVQVALLRVLETGEVRPVGGRRTRKVDVRLIAATDAPLESAVTKGTFRSALRHRLAGFQVRIPPLRERRDDLGRLFWHFLERELAAQHELDRIVGRSLRDGPWVPAHVLTRLCQYAFPGNVRELHNVVRQLVIANRWSDRFDDTVLLDALVPPKSPVSAHVSPASHPFDTIPPEPAVTSERAAVAPPPPSPSKAPSELTEAELAEALDIHQYRYGPTARALGISRNSLFSLIDKSPNLCRPKDLDATTINQASDRLGGDLAAMAAEFRVSSRGLRLRMKELGLVG